MLRLAAFVYGVTVYAFMFLIFLYLFGFLGNFLVPKSINSGPTISLGAAFVINVILIAAFSIPHSVMARPGFKQWWTRIVPNTIERSTYVLIASLLMALMFWQWQPMTQIIWQADAVWAQGVMWGLFVLGIVILFASTFIINHFDLFGLRQVFLNLKQKPYTGLNFKVTYFYKFVRHPLYVGWFLIFWATPTMTLGHLVLAIGMSVYMLIAIRYEERDLEQFHGEAYTNYKQEVPMLIPRLDKVHATIESAQVEEVNTGTRFTPQS